MESFDPKPMLTKYGGKTISETPFADAQDPKKLALERLVVPDANGNQRNELYPLQVGFKKHGQSGIEVSDWFPHTAKHVDKLAIVRSMWTTDSNHGAQTQFHSGRHRNDGEFPTLGAWVHYGLGSLNDNLPQFISLGKREYWNKRDGHYLGPAHDAVPLRIDPNHPLDFNQPGSPFAPESQAIGRNLIQDLNTLRGTEYPKDATMAARIASYELAFRMQQSIPDIVDFSKESASTKASYGLDKAHSKDFGMQLLAARRFVEEGVRFVQIWSGADNGHPRRNWDSHEDLERDHRNMAAEMDQPAAALLTDLKRRGMLDDTVVLWTTEFGRMPCSQGGLGRDHNPFGFTNWLAGGGVRGGVSYGATDEWSYRAVENPTTCNDVHATILHLLGVDHKELTFRHNGIDRRLTDVAGRVLGDVIV